MLLKPAALPDSGDDTVAHPSARDEPSARGDGVVAP